MDRETIIKLADENGLWDYFDLEGDSVGLLMLETLVKLVAEHSASVEREACAKVAENCFEGVGKHKPIIMAVEAAKAIRARGNT